MELLVADAWLYLFRDRGQSRECVNIREDVLEEGGRRLFIRET